ncbi:MAG: 4-alpha-glucanotransferase [Gemmatimonadaceae bacterium]
MKRQRAGNALRALADHAGIVAEYIDQSGCERRETSDDTRVALLAAMGINAADERAASESLNRIRNAERSRLLPPTRVSIDGRSPPTVDLFLPDTGERAADWRLELRTEPGRATTAEGRISVGRNGRCALTLPVNPGTGYHDLRLTVDAGVASARAEQSLIIVPGSCPTPASLLGGRRVFGIIANLYSVRSERNWGVGDFGDLDALVRWGSAEGAAFIGVNPLHALRNRGTDRSPYSPLSRLFRNPLYIDVEKVEEMRECAAARALMYQPSFVSELNSLRDSERVGYERTMTLKHAVLRLLYETFTARHRRESTQRGHQYARYLEVQGQPLTDFATFAALEDHLGKRFAEWPAPFRDPRSSDIESFRRESRNAIDYHRYLQFIIDCQIAGTASTAKTSGMPIGLYQDLAIGTAPDGSDPWMFPGLFARGVALGAPPDDYSASGQNWGLPPLDPHALAAGGYSYWISLVRSALHHAGALRLDHVMGLFRQYWIPEGRPGGEGAYVRFPAEDMLGILALESTRAGALVVGEDLGTVPEEVPPALRRWGVLSSAVLYFERNETGGFAPAGEYEPNSLATANTHDMPTLAGFWSGGDISLKRKVGIIDGDDAVATAETVREGERRALTDRLRAAGVLAADDDPDAENGAVLRGAVHAFLCSSPAALVGLSLDDLVGEPEPVNVPGVGAEKFPSWTRRLALPVEEIPVDAGVRAAMRCSERAWA